MASRVVYRVLLEWGPWLGGGIFMAALGAWLTGAAVPMPLVVLGAGGGLVYAVLTVIARTRQTQAEARGDLDEAERVDPQSLEVDSELGSLEGQAVVLSYSGNIALERGDLDQGERLHREALEIERKLGRLEGQANKLGILGVVA